MQYAFLLGSLFLFALWLAVFLWRKSLRKEMLSVSFFTMLFGFTEPLFVPEYWNPPTLFDLAQKTGFDIESLIFAFSFGGIGAMIFELIFPVKHLRFTEHEKMNLRHRLHSLALSSPIIIFGALYFLTSFNPIYTVSIALFGGVSATLLCRPDLFKKIIVGGLVFLSLYFFFFLGFNLVFSGYTMRVWNFPVISGIMVLGIPVEELIFALTFGMMWSGLFEHLNWFKIKQAYS